MFREAGFEEFEHRLMGPPHKPDIAITTLARVPVEAEQPEPATP
jgi:demethylmenaquinone methyltransferase/2-methoxy-6-polyprenyl-1,4-benzoquinol methylase